MQQNDQPHHDLLTQTLQFSIPQNNNDIFQFVIDGKITGLNKMLQTLPPDQVQKLVNQKDSDGKSPLFYACYYNFQNIVVYLLIKDADPFVITGTGMTIFHVCAYRGHLECATIVYSMVRHRLNVEFMDKLKTTMKSYMFKKTDINKGNLVCSDKHLKPVQLRFQQFQTEIHNIFQSLLHQMLYQYRQYVNIYDHFSPYQNTPSKRSLQSQKFFLRCLKTSKYLVMFGLKMTGWDLFYTLFQEVQLLELNRDKKVDPRQYSHTIELIQNFLEPHIYDNQCLQFQKQIRLIQKEVANTQDNDGYTPMHLASFAGDFAAVQFILQIGGDPKIKCKKGQDVLALASNDMVRKYLVDLKNAARDGDDKSFQLLVNCGHNVDGKATIYGIAPIHNALEFTHKSKKEDMLKSVISQEADVNVSDSNGWTPLHHACSYGSITAIKMLLERGAQVNRFSNKGYYPIHIAAMYNHPEVIQLLVENSADIEDDSKCTPLHLAAKKGHAKVVNSLFGFGANIYSEDNRQWTALHYAAFYEHKDVAHMLCRFDGDYDKLRQMRTSRGKLAKDLITNQEIKFAFQSTYHDIFDNLISIMASLLGRGFRYKHDINEPTIEKKYTPLILATKFGHFLIVKFLLANGADSEARDASGKAAVDYARETQNYKIYRLFEPQQQEEDA